MKLRLRQLVLSMLIALAVVGAVAPRPVMADASATVTVVVTAGANGAITLYSDETKLAKVSGTAEAETTMTFQVTTGVTLRFDIRANPGYKIVNYVVNGDSNTANTDRITATSNNTNTGMVVSAAFASTGTWPVVTAGWGPGGKVSTSNDNPGTAAPGNLTVSVDPGNGQTFYIIPNIGHHTASVTVDGQAVAIAHSYTFRENHTITAAFAINTYILTPAAVTNGSISPATPTTVVHGANQTFTITPNTGASIVDVMVDGQPVGPVTSYTFNEVNGDHTISAVINRNIYTITAGTSGNGSFSPPGPIALGYGDSQTFTITPNAGYHVADVVVDGVAAGAVTSYPFNNITASHTISATFAINTYSVAYTAGTNGSVSGDLSQVITYGGSGTEVTAVPNTGYHFTAWSDGVATPARTDSNITAAINVTANFAVDTRTITADAGSNGSISPAGAVAVGYGSSQTFTITPNTGYHVVDVVVDGVSVGAVTSYTFNNVTGGHTISAAFAINNYTLTYLAGDGGTITGNSSQTVSYSGSGTAVLATPAPGTVYRFIGWSDGVTTIARTDSNVTDNISVKANFASSFDITLSARVDGSVSPFSVVSVNYGSNQTIPITPNTGYIITDVIVDGKSAGPVASYTFNFVTANHTIIATFISPRGLKQTVIADLTALRQKTGDKQDIKSLDDAIMYLTKSLTPSYWTDETHLQTKYGNRVFQEEKDAEVKLVDLAKSNHSHVLASALMVDIQRIAAADRLLALTAIADAHNGNAKYLGMAKQELASGDNDVANGKFVSGIEHYRNAWQHAVQSTSDQRSDDRNGNDDHDDDDNDHGNDDRDDDNSRRD